MTKEISDKILKMLCHFIEQRLLTLNPPKLDVHSFSNNLKYKINKQDSLKWQGTQEELCELFYELIEKKWLPEIKYGDMKRTAYAITELFDIENTRRSENSDVQASFYQRFKGENENGKKILPFIQSKKYSQKFNKIQEKK